jgi:holliday junction DNA helicase RuvB
MNLKKTNLRPDGWSNFTGQDNTVKSIQIAIKASQSRKEPLEHVLLYGPPGLGKTTLANIIARDLNTNLKTTSGPALTRSGDLASILTSLEPGDVLFIDEIHRLNKNVEEALYPAMEDFSLDIVLGKGPGARTLRLDLNPFTIIGATTKAGAISSPLRDRFGLVHRLVYYSAKDLEVIIKNAGKIFGIKLDKDSIKEIAKRSRGTARIALKLLRRVRDYCLIEHQSKPTLDLTQKCLKFYQVDDVGLDNTDRKLLETIINLHNGGPVGLQTLASLVSEDINTITDVNEPFLLQTGFLIKTGKGRVATPKAYRHLKISLPKGK